MSAGPREDLPARLRGVVFYVLFYLLMAAFGLGLALPAALSRRAAAWVARRYFATVFLLLHWIGGARIEVRGPVPQGRVIVASKHQSMLDVFILFHALPEAHFVMKRELLRAPVFGWYARRVGAVAIDRAAGSAAIGPMIEALLGPGRETGQIVIYPQGTRVPPGTHRPYKTGVHAVYEASGLTVIPVATNVGAVLPKGLAVHPGTAVVAFLDPIPPGLGRDVFMATLEARIEAASTALLDENRA